MLEQLKKLGAALAVAGLPLTLFAFSQQTGPPVKRTGAAVDGGLNCTACHRTYAPANSQPGGFVRIETANYVPGQPQKVRVHVFHPAARKWGFQLTARMANDQTKNAGTFTSNADTQVICEDLANPANIRGIPGPCTGAALAFVNHVTAATTKGADGMMTFEVDWTPPASGDVIFYAAGNAADASANNVGDRIYTTVKQITTCGASEAPVVSTVLDATSGARAATAVNGLVTIWGSGFANTGSGVRETNRGDYANGKFPESLGCIAVEIGGVRAPILAVTPTQINAQVPTNTPTGNVPVRVIYSGSSGSPMMSETKTVTVQSHAPSIFTFDSKSAAAIVAGSETRVFSGVFPGGVDTRPAKPGEVVEVYATGLGVGEPVYQAGEFAPARPVPLRDRLTVIFGGTTLPAEAIEYAGLAPTYISGLYQVNVRIPENAPDGDVPLVLSMGGLQSQPGVILPVKR